MIAPPAAPAAAPTGPPTTAPVAAPAAAPFPAGDPHPTKPAIRPVNADNAISRYVFILVKTVLRAALGVSQLCQRRINAARRSRRGATRKERILLRREC